MEDEFWKQLTGSGAANIATALLFSVIWIVRNKCKHSRCKGHSVCCDCEIKDDETRDEDFEDIEEAVRKNVEIQVQNVQRGVNTRLPGSD